MRTTVHRAFPVWQFDKAEKWLNEMAAQGFALTGVGFCRFDFESCEPGEYSVRLELLDGLPGKPENMRYIRFLEDTGAEHVGSFLRWAYFRKRTADGAFDLFSDRKSRIRHLNRIATMLGLLTFSESCISLGQFIQYFGTHHPNAALYVAILALVAALFMGWGCCRLIIKRRRLEKESTLFE